MLFWSANWMPLTISGISGTMARTVTPIKYWRSKWERTLLQESKETEPAKATCDCAVACPVIGGVSWPERCWAGSTRAGCSPWQDQHKQTSVRWPWWGWSETSTWTSGPLLHGVGPPLQAQWVTESRCSLTVKLRDNLVTFTAACVLFLFVLF